MSVIAAWGVTGGVAGATGPPPDAAVTCGMRGTIDLGNPGISKDGSSGNNAAFVSIQSIPVGAIGCSVLSGSGSGSLNPLFQRVKCDKHTPGLPASNPACIPGQYGFDSWANFTGGSFASAIQKGTRAHFGFEFIVNGILYHESSTSSSTILSGGLCGSSEIGFQVVGKIRLPRSDRSQTMTLTECLGAITGTGLNPGDSFFDASVDQIGIVVTAAIDPATSTLHIG
jgi:hypothetical protein